MSGTKSDTNREGREDQLKRQGSFRKLLPVNTNGDSQLSMSVKMIERPVISQPNKEYAVYLQEYNILCEYSMLCTQDVKGAYVIPSAQSSLLWFGVQFVRQGLYQGAVFRFTITLPPNFPDGGCPKVNFQTKVFHPLVDPESGELCTTWGFPEWRKTNRIWQLVQYITKVLSKPDTKMSQINQGAAILLENDCESFKERVKECVRESLDHVYDPPTTDDPHYITFSADTSDIPDSIKEDMFKLKEDEEPKVLGLSWVQPGSLKPFSKPEPR